MSSNRKNALILAVFLVAGAIAAALFVVEFRESRYDACMGIGAFSGSECEEYAWE
jgi:hypothetical protein